MSEGNSEFLEGEETRWRKMIEKMNRNQKMKLITNKKARKNMGIKMIELRKKS